ncbi:MAG: hypothetical protein IJ197_07985 [Bacteroidaceae bacterium]|nr:hypothetical protein [Bacteroidaceae bacterium]
MDKFFICLANSLKRGGRCIAGIEIVFNEQDQWDIIRNSDGTPHWIRPIDPCTEFGEITNNMALPIKLLSIVKLTNVNECPHEAHTEDTYFSRMEVIGEITPTSNVLNELTDNIHTDIFYNHEYSISTLTYAEGNYSLMLIHPERIYVEPDLLKERAKYRMQIIYNGNYYEMALTDPDYLNYLSEHLKNGGTIEDVFLCLSLGLEYEFRHHKLVAGVIVPQSSITSLPHTFNRRKKKEKFIREIRPLSWRERLCIRSALYMPTYRGSSVYIRKWDGKELFITLESGKELKTRSKIRLTRLLLVKYESEGGTTSYAFRWRHNKYGEKH